MSLISQVNLASRWFIGFGLTEPVPDHSSLTCIRRHWGAERFRVIVERTVKACVAAKIATGEVVPADASPIRADVSWESLAAQHVEAVAEATAGPRRMPRRIGTCGTRRRPAGSRGSAPPTRTPRWRRTGRNRRLEPAYRQHAVVDDAFGVVLDVGVTTSEANEGQVVLERLDATAATTAVPIRTATADAGYAHAKVFGGLERRRVEAVIPPRAEPIRSLVPVRRFRYAAKHDMPRSARGARS